MPHDPTTTSRGPWRILVLDRSPDDMKFIIAVVANGGDVRPAGPGAVLDEVTVRWAAGRSGLYVPVFTRQPHPEVWRIDEHPQREGTS
jgi:hypothetical protein